MTDEPDNASGARLGRLPAKRTILRLAIVSAIVSLTLLSILGLQADWEEILHAVDAGWLVLAAASMGLLQAIAGYRLYLLLPRERAVRSLAVLDSVRVMCAFQAVIKLLPFRLGEVGFFWLTGRYLALPARATLGVFLNMRIWDFRLVALSFLIFGGLLLQDKADWARLLFVVVGLFGLAVFSLSSHRLIRMAEWVARLAHRVTAWAWTGKAADALDEAATNLVREKSVWRSLATGVSSAVMWGCIYGLYGCVYASVGVELSWTAIIMVVSGMTLFGVLPVQTIGGLGLLEMGQASLLILAGLTSTVAAAKALVVGGLYFALCVAVPACMLPALAAMRKQLSTNNA